jgi:hypothetical protein
MRNGSSMTLLPENVPPAWDIPVRGTLGIVLMAKKRGLIPSARAVMDARSPHQFLQRRFDYLASTLRRCPTDCISLRSIGSIKLCLRRQTWGCMSSS